MQKFAIHQGRSEATEGQSFIRVSSEEVDEDGVITTETGFIRVQADKADALLAKLNSGERLASFGTKLPTGLYEVEVEKAAVTAGNAIEA